LAELIQISSTLHENLDPIDRGSLQLPVAAGLVERLEVQISNTPRLTGHFHFPRPRSSSRFTAVGAGDRVHRRRLRALADAGLIRQR
jgi:hypothetical protein